jgi:DNA-binding CsgD family transcriptional regulator
MRRSSAESLLELNAELWKATDLDGFFEAAARAMPLVARCDSMYFLSAFYPVRRPVPFFQQFPFVPTHVLDGNPAKRPFEVRSYWPAPDSCKRPRRRKSRTLVDSAIVVFHEDTENPTPKGHAGTGLVLWRFDESKKFDRPELAGLQRAREILNAAWARLWNETVVRNDRDVLSGFLAKRGNLCFLVRPDGSTVRKCAMPGTEASALFGCGPKGGLPDRLAKVATRLIQSVSQAKGRSRVCEEITANGSRCRVLVSPANPEWTGDRVFRVVVSCLPAMANMKLLERDGLNEQEVATLEQMQKDQSTKSLCKALGKSEHTVEYYFRQIGKKLGVSGRATILARAIARSHEIAVELGMGGGVPNK